MLIVSLPPLRPSEGTSSGGSGGYGRRNEVAAGLAPGVNGLARHKGGMQGTSASDVCFHCRHTSTSSARLLLPRQRRRWRTAVDSVVVTSSHPTPFSASQPRRQWTGPACEWRRRRLTTITSSTADSWNLNPDNRDNQNSSSRFNRYNNDNNNNSSSSSNGHYHYDSDDKRSSKSTLQTTRSAATRQGDDTWSIGALLSPKIAFLSNGFRRLLFGDKADVAVFPKSTWSKFALMTCLFFSLSFVNAIVDSTKDTLVITAKRGGAELIPFLTAYVVLPVSMAFLVTYAKLSNVMKKSDLFRVVLGSFLAFFGLFGFLVYPFSHHLHLHGLADRLQMVLPVGMHGLIGVVCNWTFSIFYTMAELWGDVVISVLFWSLANDIFLISQAKILYPLFGVGANVAVILAGVYMKFLATTTSNGLQNLMPMLPSPNSSGAGCWTLQLQIMMVSVVLCGVVVIVLHKKLLGLQTATEEESSDKKRSGTISAGTLTAKDGNDDSQNLSKWKEDGSAKGSDALATVNGAKDGELSNAPPPSKRKMGFMESFKTLSKDPLLISMAVMSIAQGITFTFFTTSFKASLRMTYTTPSEYSAVMADISTATGAMTVIFMVLSPFIFNRKGWKAAAIVTPRVMQFGGGIFLLALSIFHLKTYYPVVGETLSTMLYQVSSWAMTVIPGREAIAEAFRNMSNVLPPPLICLTAMGAFLHVFLRAAKFALFKPAEEMIYITLDDESKTKGKAAIDVVGAQLGKTGGSLVQQGLLISLGSLAAAMPAVTGLYMVMVHMWVRATHHLDEQIRRSEGKALEDSKNEGAQGNNEENESKDKDKDKDKEEECVVDTTSRNNDSNNNNTGTATSVNRVNHHLNSYAAERFDGDDNGKSGTAVNGDNSGSVRCYATFNPVVAKDC